MFKKFLRMLRALTTNSDSGAIACAFSAGLILGLIPKDNLLWIILFVFVFFMRIDRIVFSLFIAIGALLAPLLDGAFDALGCFLLTLPALEKFYASFFEIPFVSFFKFNNSIVCGSFVSGIILFVPLYYLAKLFILLWRKYIAQYVRRFKVVQRMQKLFKAKKLVAKVN